MRCFFLVFFLSSYLFSNNSSKEEFASLHGEPSALIYDCVNAITGDLVFQQVDCTVRGAEVLYLPRRYISREVENPHLRWQILSYAMAIVEMHLTINAYVPEPSGISLFYSPQKGAIKRDSKYYTIPEPLELHPHPEQFRAGLVHDHGSSYHPLSNKVILEGEVLKVIHADGSYRIYKFHKKKSDNFKTTIKMLLDHEKLPNGNLIYYTWNKKDNIPVLNSIKAYSPTNILLGSIKIGIHKKKISITTSDEQELKYKYTNTKKKPLLTSVTTTEHPKENLTYNEEFRLKEKSFPDGRKLKIKYYENGKVKKLIGPQGTLYSFTYYRDFTEAVDFQGNKTLYHFDEKTLRLLKIETFQNHILLKSEVFTWDSLGNLISKQISPNLTMQYTYDEQGKVKTKTLVGTITSEGLEEHYTTYYTYNDQNLLIEEKEENGLSATNTYLEGTNLLTSKIFKKNAQILKRLLYEYNEHNVLIAEIIDDGPEYTERHIKRITPKTTYPFFGLPEIIEEYYQEEKTEVLLKKIHFIYDIYGNITERVIYDSQQNLCFSEQIHCNNKRQVIKELDREGNITSYAYDLNGNKIQEIFPLGLTTTYTYDKLNHCIEKNQENYKTIFSAFTIHGKPTHITDPLNAITHMNYDGLGRLISKTDPLNSTTTYSYNSLDQQESATDPLGNTTRICYNIYGSPLKITYADATEELYTYALDGRKLTYTNQKNLTTFYTYDDFHNIIKEELFEGANCIFTVQRSYSAFHLLEEIDSEGLKTTYIYGPSGRLEKKIYGALVLNYSYDTLGRCTHETALDYTLENTYDYLDRLTAKKEYAKDKLLTQVEYTYDAYSHIIKQVTYPNNQQATTTYTYDALGREIEKIDPLGQITTTTYVLGDKTLQKKILEPGEIEVIETYNALNQKTHIEKRHLDQIIANSSCTYDPCGNIKVYTTSVYRGKNSPSTHVVSYAYDNMNRKISQLESDQKLTSYTYTPKGQLASLTKPNGIILNYTYNALGYLEHLRSSENTIDYTYKYNTKGQLLVSYDNIQNTKTERVLDLHGNVIQETLGNDFTLKSTYDALQRRTSLELPNQKTIFYKYEAFCLKSVDFDSYEHSYSYDLIGKIIEETAIDQTQIQKNYDLLHRPIKLTSSKFHQECIYDVRGNIVRMDYRKKIQDYTYDPLDHLTSDSFHKYSYDSLHNRISKDGISYTLNSLNQIEKADCNYTYDANGNLIAREGMTFEYDALDRLIKVITPTNTFTYTYDSEHRRLTNNEEKYIWDNLHEIGTLDCYRILGNTTNAEIGSSIALIKEDLIYLPIHDLQGNLIEVFSIDGNPLEKRTYTAFGEYFGPRIMPWGFCSKRHDLETRLVYFGRRYYDPVLGRFVTPDPEGYIDTYNLYAYCRNNPLSHFDLYGLLMISSFRTADFNSIHQSSLFNQDIVNSVQKSLCFFPKQIINTYNAINDFCADHRLTRSGPYQVGNKELPRGNILFVNGINNEKTDAMRSATMISALAQGTIINGMYNASNYLMNDVKECIGAHLGMRSTVCKQLCDYFTEFSRTYGPDAKLFAIGHSGGSEDLYHCLERLPEAIRKQIIVLAIAPSRIIPNDLCFQSYNYASRRDFVSHLDFLGKMKHGHELKILEPHSDAPLWDHSFDSPTFTETIQYHISEYIKEYGAMK